MARKSKKLDVTGFLKMSKKQRAVPVVALVGPEDFLRQLAFDRLRKDAGEDTTYTDVRVGKTPPELADVLDELRTRSLFGGGELVRVRPADSFISAHRKGMERFLEHIEEEAQGQLVLEMEKLDGRTNVSKLIKNKGLVVECESMYDAPPPWEAGRPAWDSPLTHWLVDWARDRYRLDLQPEVAFTLHRQTGNDLGEIDQALKRLELFLARAEKNAQGLRPVTHEVVQEVIGHSRQDRIFELEDAVGRRDLPGALEVLDNLMTNGLVTSRETLSDPSTIALILLGSLRRRLSRLRLVVEHLKRGARKQELGKVLGIPSRQSFRINKAIQGGRRFMEADFPRLWDVIIEADYQVKGGSEKPARLVIEEALVRLLKS